MSADRSRTGSAYWYKKISPELLGLLDDLAEDQGDHLIERFSIEGGVPADARAMLAEYGYCDPSQSIVSTVSPQSIASNSVPDTAPASSVRNFIFESINFDVNAFLQGIESQITEAESFEANAQVAAAERLQYIAEVKAAANRQYDDKGNLLPTLLILPAKTYSFSLWIWSPDNNEMLSRRVELTLETPWRVVRYWCLMLLMNFANLQSLYTLQLAALSQKIEQEKSASQPQKSVSIPEKSPVPKGTQTIDPKDGKPPLIVTPVNSEALNALYEKAKKTKGRSVI